MKAFVALLLTAAAAGPLTAQTYIIHLTRHVAPGQTYAFSATGSSRQLASAGERTIKADDFQVNFEGRAKVVEVDRTGEPYKLAFTVAKFTRTKDDTTVDLLQPGTVIIADGSKSEKLSLQDGIMDTSTQQAFRVVYSAHQPNTISDDEIFGTKQARSVGESWPANAVLAADSVQKEAGITIPPDQLSATTRFVAVNKIGGVDCAQVERHVNADNFSGKDPRSGISFTRGSLKAEIRGCYPLSPSAQSYKETQELQFDLPMTARDGSSMRMTAVSKAEVIWSASGETP